MRIRSFSGTLAGAGALLLGCGDGTAPDGRAPATGRLVIITATAGVDIDPDGYAVTIDGSAPRTLGANDTLTIDGVAVGSHAVAIEGLASNCRAGESTGAHIVSVVRDAAARVNIALTCSVGGRFAFTVVRRGWWAIIVADADGGNQQLLKNPIGGNDLLAAWSPDGSRIAFASDRHGDFEVYVADPDGANTVRLTNDRLWDNYPSWSPDGTKIAFSSTRTGGGDIYIMNADGSGVTRVTTGATQDIDPQWSPDGQRLVFVGIGRADPDVGNYDLYTVNVDGTGLVRLTSEPAMQWQPVWSPDGSRIAYTHIVQGAATYHIRLIAPDGSDAVELTPVAMRAFDASWSRDGSRLAFFGVTQAGWRVVVMGVDGETVTTIALPLADEFHHLSWHP